MLNLNHIHHKEKDCFFFETNSLIIFEEFFIFNDFTNTSFVKTFKSYIFVNWGWVNSLKLFFGTKIFFNVLFSSIDKGTGGLSCSSSDSNLSPSSYVWFCKNSSDIYFLLILFL